MRFSVFFCFVFFRIFLIFWIYQIFRIFRNFRIDFAFFWQSIQNDLWFNVCYLQTIRIALLGTSIPGTRFFYLRNAAGTRSFFQRQEGSRNALLVPFLNNFYVENFKDIYYLKIRCVQANSSILLKWLKLKSDIFYRSSVPLKIYSCEWKTL